MAERTPRLAFEFPIVNTSDKARRLTLESKSCSCLEVSCDEIHLLPAGRAFLTVGGKVGLKERHAHFSTLWKDDYGCMFRFTLNASVRRALRFAESALELKWQAGEDLIARTSLLVSPDLSPKDLAAAKLVCAPSAVSAAIAVRQGDATQQGLEVVIRVPLKTLEERSGGRVALRYFVDGVEHLDELVVSWRRNSLLLASPRSLHFGRAVGNGDSYRVFEIRHPSERKFRILSFSAPAHVTVSYSSQASDRHQIRVELSSIDTGYVSGDLHFMTDIDKHPVVVPFTAWLIPAKPGDKQ